MCGERSWAGSLNAYPKTCMVRTTLTRKAHFDFLVSFHPADIPTCRRHSQWRAGFERVAASDATGNTDEQQQQRHTGQQLKSGWYARSRGRADFRPSGQFHAGCAVDSPRAETLAR